MSINMNHLKLILAFSLLNISISFSQSLLPVWGKQFVLNYQTGMEFGNSVFDVDEKDNIYFSVSFPDQLKVDNITLKSENKLSNIVVRVSEKGKIQWYKAWMKESEKIYVNDILTLSDNCILVSGNYWGKYKVNDIITLDSFNSNGNTYVLCLDSSGNIVWAKGFSNKSVIDFFKGPNGEIYFFAKIMGTGTNYRVFDSIIAADKRAYGEINEKGELIWIKSKNFIDAIAIDKNKNCYAAGIFGGWAYPEELILDTFVLKASSAERNDIFLTKINQDGSVKWIKTIKGFTDNDPGIDSRKLCVDENNNLYLSFEYRDSIFVNQQFYKGIKSDRFFVVKFNEYGDFQWFKESSTTFDELTERAVSITYSAGTLFARAFMHSESVFQGLSFPTINEETAIIEIDTSGLTIKQTTLKIKDALYKKGNGYAYYQFGPLKRNPNLIINGWEFKPIENDWILIKVDTLTWWTDITKSDIKKQKIIKNISRTSIHLNPEITAENPWYYEIVESGGRIVDKGNLHHEQAEIDIRKFPSGFYMIRIFYKSGFVAEKFLF